MDFDLFEKFRVLVYDRSGIALGEDKTALVSMRIARRLRELGIKSEQEYYDYLVTAGDADELISFIDVISTNVTYFFREPPHFTHLKSVLEELKFKGQNKIKIWCGASSSGEEPYTIAMTAREVFFGLQTEVKILATDISTQVLKKAVAGFYETEKLVDVPEDYLMRYFDRVHGGYEVKQAVKNMVMFRQLNLKADPLPLHGPIDIVFLRNVMIYFDSPLRKQIVDNIYHLLTPGGILYLSHTESLTGIQGKYKAHGPSIYVKPTDEEDADAERSTVPS